MNSEECKCFVCNRDIIPERVAFLLESGVRPIDLTCTQHSQTKRIQGLFIGEVGTSQLILCDKVFNDSVRSKFVEPAEEEQEEE